MPANHRLPLFSPSVAGADSPDASGVDASDGVELLVIQEEAARISAAASSSVRARAREGAREDGRPDGGHENARDLGAAIREEELMQVGDLAKETGKTVRAIHLYEELQLLKPAARSKGRYRLYNRGALVRIRWIGKLQDMGFSLTDIQSVVRDWEDGASASSTMRKMREVYKKKLDETRAHLARLQTLAREIEASLSYLETCDDVCAPERLLSFCKKCELHGCEDHVPDLVAGFRVS